MHVRTRGKYSGAARIDERLSLMLAAAEARRSVLRANSGGSMPSRCERKRLRQGAAGGGGEDIVVVVVAVVSV